jgi:putative glutamine amidotransferase
MKPNTRYILSYFSIIFFLFAGIAQAQEPVEKNKLIIAISKGHGSNHYINYIPWIKSSEKDLEIIDMIEMNPEEAAIALEKCDGLVLSGGADVDPAKYGKESEISRCEVDSRRDSIEFALIKKARKMKLPILGICRGEQILNVAFGGSLITDIPTDIGSNYHSCPNPDTCYHEITIKKGSLLNRLCNLNFGKINTNHHQSVDRIAQQFRVSAKSDDGVVEAYEWKNPKGKPFLLAVQWHPERLERNSAFSQPILTAFIKKAEKYQINKEKYMKKRNKKK